MKRRCLFGVMLLLGSATVHGQQICLESIDRSAPEGRFVILSEGVVRDLITDFLWQRCPLGYTLHDNGTERADDDRCLASNEVIFTWQGALQASEEFDDGAGIWRLPNVKELSTLVESACAFPAIANSVFPDTANTAFWTSTPNSSELARTVSFAVGSVTSTLRSEMRHVRLMNGPASAVAVPES